MGEKLKQHFKTIDDLIKPIPKPTPDSLLGVMTSVGEERDRYRKALEHIANVSDSYESKYARKILDS